MDHQQKNESTHLLSSNSVSSYDSIRSSSVFPKRANIIIYYASRMFLYFAIFSSVVILLQIFPSTQWSIRDSEPLSLLSFFRVIPFIQSDWYYPLMHHHHHRHIVYHKSRDHYDTLPYCGDDPCFQPPDIGYNIPQVRTDLEGFPSFWNYATGEDPIDISYNSRSILINGEQVMFVGGSMHPSRATPQTWEKSLDYAVDSGLNLITIYIMWSAHQPTADSPLDWKLTPQPIDQSESSEWTIASAIVSAARRGLFVHVRIGPYVCAEYNYGGIPEWIPFTDPNMSMRRPNGPWLDAMEKFVTAVVSYLQEERLFAYQGGPIIMAQIENELGGNVDPITEHLLQVDSDGKFIEPHSNSFWAEHAKNRWSFSSRDLKDVRSATLQDYADWCGELANRLAPKVIWTMCNGLSAANTINTYNGQFRETKWLDQHGNSKRIQIDQPALWSEHEMGFQIWGEESSNPTDYFWGSTARSIAYCTLRWFARGGSHVNYYMWWGGYNRERMAAAGVTNSYASDAPLCPSGEPRQPNFAHLRSLTNILADISYILLHSKSGPRHGKQLDVRDRNGYWRTGNLQRSFTFQGDDYDDREIILVENASNFTKAVRLDVCCRHNTESIMELHPYSIIVIVDGEIVYDSAVVNPRSMSFGRVFEIDPVMLHGWEMIAETIGASSHDPLTRVMTYPIEQSYLDFVSRISSDYAWFETDFELVSFDSWILHVETQEANGFVVFLGQEFVGHADSHLHREGNVTLKIDLGVLDAGYHKLSLLSESLGYCNLIGRWSASPK
jgi:Glycosyl hydrolases family 35